jgi:hypothetical protein
MRERASKKEVGEDSRGGGGGAKEREREGLKVPMKLVSGVVLVQFN